jgi:hypothetical protein
MKRFAVAAVLPAFVVGALPGFASQHKKLAPSKSEAATKCALNDALEMGRKTQWKGYENFLAATRYIQVILGNKAHIYTREGKYIRSGRAAHASAGLMDDYAEAYWELLDKDKKVFSDTFACMILRYRDGKWAIVAKGGTDGYEDSWKNKGIPKSVIRRLKQK